MVYQESQHNVVIRLGPWSQQSELNNQFCHLIDSVTIDKLLNLPERSLSSVKIRIITVPVSTGY